MNNNVKSQTLWGRIFQVLITWTVYFLFRPKVIFTDKSLKKRLKCMPCVFVGNHTHHFDGAYGPAVLWRYKPYILVKKQWYEKKRTGKMISWCRSIPINLDEADGSWIFPEGGLSRDGEIHEFKPGAALLSAKKGVPIVPCAIYGTYSPVFGMRQKMLVGEPIESNCPENMRHSKYARQIIAEAERSVRDLYAQMVERYGGCGQYCK